MKIKLLVTTIILLMIFIGCKTASASKIEDVPGNLEFLQFLKTKYNNPVIKPSYGDMGGYVEGCGQQSPWNNDWMQYLFREDECTNGHVNCYDKLITYLRNNWDNGDKYTICMGLYKGIKESKYRHIWLEINGVPFDPEPTQNVSDALKTAQFEL